LWVPPAAACVGNQATISERQPVGASTRAQDSAGGAGSGAETGWIEGSDLPGSGRASWQLACYPAARDRFIAISDPVQSTPRAKREGAAT
jgi:hypothetical protein